MRRFFLTLFLLLLVAYLLTGVTQIQPGEQGVVRRFGQVVAKPGPGLYLAWPWGIDRVDHVLVYRVRHVPVGYQPEREDDEQATVPGQLLTGDHNLVNLQVMVDYAVDSDRVDDYLIHGDRAESVLARVAEAAMAEWVAGRPVDEVLLTAKAALPEWLTKHVQQRLDDPAAPYQLGIRVQSASVAYLLPPTQVKADFDAVTSAQTAIRTQENEARQTALRLRREADIERFRLQQSTAARVNELTRMAQTEADGFEQRRRGYEMLRRQNPDVLASIWWAETGRLLEQLRRNGRIDLLDSRVSGDALDISTFVPQPKK
jgi:membrane protease subunit HflK